MLEAFILEGSSYFEALSQASAVWGYPLLSISTREPFLPTSGLGPRGSWLNPLVPHRHCTRHHFKANQPGAAQPTSMTTVVDPTTTEGHTASMWVPRHVWRQEGPAESYKRHWGTLNPP